MHPLDAIIVAGGRGHRFGAKKQFLELAGRPVLVHAARCFIEHPLVAAIVVVVPEEDVEAARSLFDGCPKKLTVVAGGGTRRESVYRGLAHGAGGGAVLIHDGVRPFPSFDLVERVVLGLEGAHGCIPGLRVSDTLKETVDGVVTRTVPREGLFTVQTPQAFITHAILEAHERAKAQNLTVTDDSGLMEAMGYRVRVVEGDPLNIKITYPPDIKLAEAILACRTG